MSESASRGVHTSDSSMATGLALAIQLGDLALCKSVVSAGTTIPDSLSSCGDCNPILLALLYQRWEIAQYLITRGASTTGQLCSRWELRGYSAVHLASIQPSSSSLLRILLKKDLEAGNLSFQGPVNPVHVAVAHNNIAGLRVLLQHAEAQNWAQKAKTRDESLSSEVINHAGVNIHTASSPSFSLLGKNGSLCDVKISSQLKWTWKLGSLRIKRFCGAGAMHIAAEIDSVESVKALLEYGATIDCINIFNQTPAHIAALMRHSQLLYLLNQYGSNMNLQYFGRTTAMFAVAGGLALNTNGWVTIEWSDCDQKGSSILHYAGSGNPIMLSSLLEMGCDPYSTNTDGYTAIELAIRTSITSPALLSICLNWDLDFDRCIICIWSIFSQSDHTDFADTRQQRILKRLFRRLPTTRVRRELNTIPTRGSIRETPLVQAARGGEPQILDLLVQAGAALDLEGGPQSTPLLTACKEGRLSSVVHLVRMGAKVFSSRNGREYTAVQAAAWFPKIIRWLLVERYTDQTKICWESAENVEREIVAWQGPMTVEVAIAGLYSATHGASSFEKTKDLAEFRRDFRGKVVYLEGLHSLVSSIIPTTA
jgi:ankyrin repeat protein